MTERPVILILAAGSSSRMRGRDKLLEPVGPEPMLRRQARIAWETDCPVLVTLPVASAVRQAALDGLSVARIGVPDAARGMSASLRAGVVYARDLASETPGLMILPADMPDFTAPALLAVIDAFLRDPHCIVRGTVEDGQPGHPAIFPRDLWDALAAVTGDEGGRRVIAANLNRIRTVALPGHMALTDLDTPEDWQTWRALRGVV